MSPHTHGDRVKERKSEGAKEIRTFLMRQFITVVWWKEERKERSPQKTLSQTPCDFRRSSSVLRPHSSHQLSLLTTIATTMSSRSTTRPHKVLLTSSEGTEFLIDRDVADMSQLLKCMFQDIGEIGLGTGEPSA